MDQPYHYYFVTYADVFGGMLRSPAFWAVLLGLLAVSAYHDRRTKLTLHAYAERRAEEGADADGWPGDGAYMMRMGPQVLYAGGFVALLLGVLQTINAVSSTVLDTLMSHGHAPADFTQLTVAVLAVALGGLLFTAARRIRRSPWYPVAERIRRSVYARTAAREELFAEALTLDPGV